MSSLTAKDLALHIAHIAWEKDGQDLKVMVFPPGAQICDVCVLVTARSDRQTRAIAEEAQRFAKRMKVHHHPVEGETGWILVDLGEVILHVFSAEKRALYALDALWPRVTVIDHEAGFRRLKLASTPPADS